MEQDSFSGVSSSSATRPDTSEYSLSVDDAVLLFDQAGVSRDPRTIERNCKDGQLNCIKVETVNASKYMINRTSVDIRIEQLKAVTKLSVKLDPDVSGHAETHRDPSGQGATRLDASRNVAADSGIEVEALKKRVEELELANRSLEIDKAVRDRSVQWLEKQLTLTNERDERYILQLIEQSKLIGKMETQLALAGPDKVPVSLPRSALDRDPDGNAKFNTPEHSIHENDRPQTPPRQEVDNSDVETFPDHL